MIIEAEAGPLSTFLFLILFRKVWLPEILEPRPTGG